MKLKYALLSFLFVASTVQAQWDVPVRIELVGDQPEDRQILGLADPNATDAAVSLDAARATSMSYATATGNSILAADLQPAPAAYTPGMAVTIVPAEANAPGAMMDLNGLGAVPIVKWGSVPLDSADLRAGMPARMVYDGTRFLLLSTSYLSCPSGFKPVGAQFCISELDNGPGTFYEAATHCAALGARMCSFNEWLQACRSDPSFISTVDPAGEWVDSAANNVSDAKRMGVGSNGSGAESWTPDCELGATNIPTLVSRIRCCSNR